MELIYQYYDTAIIVACLGALIAGAVILGLVVFVFRRGEEVEEAVEEREEREEWE